MNHTYPYMHDKGVEVVYYVKKKHALFVAIFTAKGIYLNWLGQY